MIVGAMEIFVDEYVPSNGNVINVSVADFKIIYSDELTAKSFHEQLDFRSIPPMLVISSFENEVSAYCRTARQEFPKWKIINIIKDEDCRLPASLPENETDIKITNDGKMLVRRLKFYSPPERSVHYSNTGVYVITDGLGFVGRNLAKTIYENGGKNIILLSSTRDSLPADWNFDFKPVVVKCDVTDQNEVYQFFSSLTQPVKGIVHTAGVLSDKTLPNLTNDDWEKVYSSKVNGARNIDNAIQELQITPTFVVFCSSIASCFGSSGRANYAAANGALDALARKRENYFSIQWGAWLGGGMDDDISIRRSSRMGIVGLTCENACKQFHRVIHNVDKVVIICPLNPDTLPFTLYFSNISTRDKRGYTSTISLEELRKQTDSEQVLSNHIKNLLKELGIDEISNDTPLFEGGLDSISAVEFKNMLEKDFEISLSDTIVFDFPTIQKMVRYMLSLNNSIKKKSSNTDIKLFDPIAIIAMACDYPKNIDCPFTLFQFLDNGGDAVTDIPEDRFDVSDIPSIYVKKGAFLESMMTFDNDAFNISEAEARQMDPQQRKCLELTSELLSHLNANVENTGVFVTGTTNAANLSCDLNSPYSATGASFAVLSNRISYIFGLKGPSMTIDTACSSSLVAIDVACRALSHNDCKQAIVIGGNYLNVEGYVGTCSAKMLSPDGRCATFSNHANGYARAEGFGGIVLKRLVDAVRDQDNICAVIKSTAIIQDGTSANLTSPNGPSQEDCISLALARANLTVDDIDFVETHGTGTNLGDPIEVNALSNVFHTRVSPLPLGAVKSNMGHMENGAGMVGVLKVIMCMKHKRLTKNIHCDNINEHIKKHIDSKVITIPNKDHIIFDSNKNLFHAGVSSFGFGGTNAHIILGFMH
jgi:3-oxoacyl-(acyl-carrier-protein) synthase/acyl carrier protein